MPILLFKNLPERAASEIDLCRDDRIYRIPTVKIVRNPAQPRKSFDDTSLFSLAESIRRYGIMQPLSVREIFAGERYELIAG